MPPSNPNSPGSGIPQHDPDRPDLAVTLVKWWLTRDRVAGYARHAATWLCGWLVARGLIDPASSGELVLGSIVQLLMLIWALGTKQSTRPRHYIFSVIRHGASVIGSVVVFKGWLSNDAFDQLLQCVLGWAAVSTFSGKAGEKYTPRAFPPIEGEDDETTTN